MFELNVPQVIDGFTYILAETTDAVENFKQMIQQENAAWAILDEKKLLDDVASEKLKELGKNLDNVVRRFLFVYDGDELVGWSFGAQENRETFYMINSRIKPAYRRRGLYSKALRIMVDHVKTLGFQRIYSRHHADNNPVLIAKLKFGFVITGMQMSEVFGLLIHLTWFAHPKTFEVYAARVGHRKLNRELLQYLPLGDD